MKLLIKFAAFVLLTGVLINLSCQKEISCENCGTNPPGATNKSPIANAGPDQVITLPSDSVSLDGSLSSDPDGTISGYLWKKISGPAFFNITRPSDSITKVKTLTVGAYQFELKVTDNGGLSAKDTMRVIVNDPAQPNRPPVANAGADQTITLPANTINLDGGGSTDPDNNITGYAWTKISGPSIFSISNSNVLQIQVINLVQGIYQFELKVTDAGTLFSKDTVQVTVNPDVPPPPSSCAPVTRPLISAQLIPIGTLSQARSGSVAAAAGNKILFTGADSYTSTTVTSKVDIYDIGTGGMTTVQLSQARVSMGVAVLGNKIYLAGGLIPIQLYPGGSWVLNGTASTVIDIYDASANNWTTDQLSTARAPMGASVNNKVVFAAGNEYYWPSSAADIYDAGNNSWSTAMISNGRRVRAVTTIGNKIFFAGGDGDIDRLVSNIDIYDAASNTWTVEYLPPPFDQGWAPTGIAVGNKNYWAGGQYYSPATYIQPTDQVLIRDESTNNSTWACLFQPNSHFDAVVKNNKIVFFTGWGLVKNKFDIYDIATNTWSIGVLSQDIVGASIISVNNTIYVAGGEVNGVLSNQVWKLEF